MDCPCREIHGLLQAAAHDQPHGHDGDPDDERDAPAPGLHRVGVEQKGQHHSNHSRERRGRSLARDLPHSVLPALSRGRRLQQIGSGRSDLAAQREALDQARHDHQDRRREPDSRVRRRRGEQHHAHRHQSDTQHHRRLAPGAVRVSADHDPSERAGDEADAERGNREQEADERIVRRKKRAPDHHREEGIGGEVVKLEPVSQHRRDHGAGRDRRRRFRRARRRHAKGRSFGHASGFSVLRRGQAIDYAKPGIRPPANFQICIRREGFPNRRALKAAADRGAGSRVSWFL